MIYLSPGEDGKLILKQALFFRQTLEIRVFICSINDKPLLFKKIISCKKKDFENKITSEKLK
jgi:hypothetical protein